MSPGSDLALKHPGFLRLEIWQGQRYPIHTEQKLHRILPKFQKSWANQSKVMGQNRAFFVKMGILGAFLALKFPRGTDQISKMGERSRFRYWDMKNWIQHHKNHYKDIHHGILDKHYKKAPKRGVLALKEPPGHTQELSRSTDPILCSNQLVTTF